MFYQFHIWNSAAGTKLFSEDFIQISIALWNNVRNHTAKQTSLHWRKACLQQGKRAHTHARISTGEVKLTIFTSRQVTAREIISLSWIRWSCIWSLYRRKWRRGRLERAAVPCRCNVVNGTFPFPSLRFELRTERAPENFIPVPHSKRPPLLNSFTQWGESVLRLFYRYK